jgi:hypothetical protein
VQPSGGTVGSVDDDRFAFYRGLERSHALHGIAGALDPDPARASFLIERAGIVIRGAEQQLHWAVLGNCRREAIRTAEPGS